MISSFRQQFLLVFCGGMRSTDDFQNIMRIFSALDLSLVKIL